jgi:hypothetical protein
MKSASENCDGPDVSQNDPISPLAPDCSPRPIPRLWPGQTAVLIGGGESLLRADVDHVRSKARTIGINDAWRMAPWADLLYGADKPWWDYYAGVPDFAGERWTQDKQKGREAAEQWGLRLVRSEPGSDLSFDPAFVCQGWNSGFQAMNLAVLFGCSRILLLGFDMQGSHWFGSHPGKLNRASPYPLFIAAFTRAAAQLAAAGIEVVNCSRTTALECFPRATIEQALP